MATEPNHAGEFLLSEASGNRSREVVTVVAGQVLAAGTVVGKITANDKYAVYDNGASDGTEVAAGVIYNAVDTSATGLNADSEQLVIVRDAEVDANLLTSNDANGTTDLLSLGIIVRS